MTPRTRTTRLGGIAVASLLAVGLTACSSDVTVSPPTEEDAADGQEQLDPAAVVEAGMATFDDTSYSLTVTAGEFATGQISHDPVAQTSHAVTSVSFPIDGYPAGEAIEAEVIGIGADTWVKPSGAVFAMIPELSGSWIHTTNRDSLSFVGMNLQQLTDQLFDSLSNVEQVDANTYTAEVNATSVSQLPTAEPFTVTIVLDDDGRLVEMTGDLVMPSEASQPIPASITVTGYGDPVDVTAPPADQVVELDELDLSRIGR